MTTHTPFTRLAAAATLHLFLAMLVLIPWSARARVGQTIGGPLQPDGVEISELVIDLHEHLDLLYGDQRIGWGGRFVLDIDMDDTGIDFHLADRANDGTTCEITMVSDGGELLLEYTPDCDPPRLFDVLEAVFPGMVDAGPLHAWWETNGGNGDGDDQQDTEGQYHFDDDMFREDGGGHCSFGMCLLNTAFALAAGVAVGTVSPVAGVLVGFLGVGGAIWLCIDNMTSDECQDYLVEEMVYLIDETLGWQYLDVLVDLDAFLQYIEQLLAQVVQTETYVTEIGLIAVYATLEVDILLATEHLVQVLPLLEV